MPYAKIEPSGCVERYGLVQTRFDLFLTPEDKRYEERYILVPVIPKEGYPGLVDKSGVPIDKADYDAWIASLPHIYQLNPFHSHFLYFEPDVSQDTVLEAINHHIPNFYEAWLQEWDLVKGGMRHGWDVATRGRPRRYNLEMSPQEYQARKLECLAKVDLIRASNLSIQSTGKGETFPATAIDVGSAATDRGDDVGPGNTYVDKANPANDTGSIDTIEIYAFSGFNLVNCEVATFFVVSGDNLSTRDSEAIGAVTSGSKQTFSGKDMDVTSGDYIGTHYTGGKIEADSSGGSGLLVTYTSDDIPCTNEAFSTLAGYAISLYGTGETPSGYGHKVTGVAVASIAKVNGVATASIAKVLGT